MLPPSARIGPGGSIVLHLADGGSRGSDLYLGRASADLVRGLQPGERMILLEHERPEGHEARGGGKKGKATSG
jgi:hypothetical protein